MQIADQNQNGKILSCKLFYLKFDEVLSRHGDKFFVRNCALPANCLTCEIFGIIKVAILLSRVKFNLVPTVLSALPLLHRYEKTLVAADHVSKITEGGVGKGK